jgi:hypothetical protein
MHELKSLLHAHGAKTICLALFLLSAWGSELHAQAPIKIVLVGDSTVAVQGGWGPGFCAQLIARAECLDLAADGRSTKSYHDEGL